MSGKSPDMDEKPQTNEQIWLNWAKWWKPNKVYPLDCLSIIESYKMKLHDKRCLWVLYKKYSTYYTIFLLQKSSKIVLSFLGNF